MLKVGDVICDMHYGSNFVGMLSRAEKYHGVYKNIDGRKLYFRSFVEWRDEPDDLPLDTNITFYRYIGSILKGLGRQYINKMLVVVGEKMPYENGPGHWFVAAYCYDGRRCGVCEVSEVEETGNVDKEKRV